MADDEVVNPDTFALFIHHGGYFDNYGGFPVYAKGFYLGLFDLVPRTFDYAKLTRAVKFVGYESWSKLFFRYPRTNTFVLIEGDTQVKQMLNLLNEGIYVVSVYVEGEIDDGSGRLQKNIENIDVTHNAVFTNPREKNEQVNNDFIEGSLIDSVMIEPEIVETQAGDGDLTQLENARAGMEETQVGDVDLTQLENARAGMEETQAGDVDLTQLENARAGMEETQAGDVSEADSSDLDEILDEIEHEFIT